MFLAKLAIVQLEFIFLIILDFCLNKIFDLSMLQIFSFIHKSALFVSPNLINLRGASHSS